MDGGGLFGGGLRFGGALRDLSPQLHRVGESLSFSAFHLIDECVVALEIRIRLICVNGFAGRLIDAEGHRAVLRCLGHDDRKVIAAGVDAFRDIDADLGAADADGGDRRIEHHGVGVGLGDLSADEGEDALDDRHRDGAVLGAGIVDHFIQNDVAILGHGESGLVGEHDADGAVRPGLDDVALKDR